MEKEKKQLLKMIDNIQTMVSTLGDNLIQVQRRMIDTENRMNQQEVRLKKTMGIALEALNEVKEGK